MKKIIYMLLTFVLFISSAYSQEKDSLIQLYPGLGDTLYLFDRDYFDLFQNIDGFEYATFYIRNDKYLISKVAFTNNEILYDTTAIQNIGVLQSERSKIEQSLLENDKQDYSPREVIISTKNGKTYSGKLDMFSKDNLYLSSTQDLQSGEDAKAKLSIRVSKLDSIIFIGESDVLYSTAMGTLAGATFGGVLALAASGDELMQGIFLIAGAFFALIGGASGLLIGLSNSEDDIVIRIDNQIDLLKLKNYAKYYFRNDKTLEEKYVELE